MSDRRAPAETLFRLALRLHPARFRDRYESELIACFRDSWRAEAAGRGPGRAIAFWARAASGVLATAWRQRTVALRASKRKGRAGMGLWRQDFRLGLRGLLRRPAWSTVVVLTLGLGMGATIAVFSVLHAVLVAPLPWENGGRMVRLYLRNTVNGSERLHLSAPAAQELRDQAASFAAVAFAESSAPGVDVSGAEGAERFGDLRVNSEYFAALGATVVAGRGFERHEEAVDAAVAVITESLANRYLEGASAAVGRSIILDAVPHLVIGVVSDDTRDPLAGAVDVWRPTPLAETTDTWDNNYLEGLARLAPGVTVEGARAELDVLARRHASLGPYAAEKEFMIVPLRDDLVGPARSLLFALSGAVSFLLLLTCSNVASLLLARAAARERELAIRTALGSTRSDLIRYFTAETAVVALASGLCGLGVGRLALQVLVTIAPADLPLRGTIGFGWWTAGLAGGMAVLVALSLGLGTSLPFLRPRLYPKLAESGRAGHEGVAARRMRELLVITDVALAVVLLVGAGVLLRTLYELRGRDLGIDPAGVVTFDAHLPEARYPSAELRIRFHEDLRERLEAIPGVTVAGATSHLPLTGSANTWGTRRAAAQGEPFDTRGIQGNQRIVSGGYFEAVGARLIAGRLVDERDGPNAPHAVVVNETLARMLFGDENPVGQLLAVGPFFPVIVGVVDDIALTARIVSRPMVFHPFPQFGAPRRWPMTHVVRLDTAVVGLWEAIRSALAEVDPNLVLHAPRALDEVVVADIGDERFAAFLLQSFAALALILVALGLYGLLAHSVQQRRQEIGVRMALGADRLSVQRMVIRRGIGLSLTGTAAGLTLALALSPTLDFLVFGVSARDPVVFASVPLLLFGIAAAASYLPSRRATRVEPVNSLKAY